MASTLHNNGGKKPESGAGADSKRSTFRNARNGSGPDGLPAGNRRTEAQWRMDEALARAVARGDLGSVEHMMGHGAKATPRILQSCAGLMDNAFSGHPDAARRFIASAGDVNASGEDGMTPLIRSARDGDSVGMIGIILDLGADVDAKDRVGETALMKAAREGRTEIVDLLLAQGADPNATDSGGRTPLMKAAMYNRVEAAEILIGNRAKLDAQDENGETAMIKAGREGNDAMITSLMSHGAGTTLKEKRYGWTARTMAIYWNHERTAKLLPAEEGA